MRFLLLALAGALLASPALAKNGACGTVIVPPGLGIGPGADLTSFNLLFITSEYNEEAANMMFEQLLWVNRYHEIDWQRSIASAVTTPDQGKTYEITLRPWKWSDGAPVTSADVLYTYRLIQAYGAKYANYGAGGVPMLIASMSAPDAAHVQVVLKHSVNPQWFILNGLSQLIPFPQHVWGRYTPDEIWQEQSSPAFFAVDDGPLILKVLNVGIDAEFAPNPLYGGAPMHFQHFIMKFQFAEAQELEAAQSGDIDMSNIPFALFNKASEIPGYRVVTLPPTYSWHELIPNMANAATRFFADARVRQAMADAIDERKIIKLAMNGHGIATRGPVPPVPGTFLSPAAKAGDFPVGYDPAKARALLAQAGWKAGPDGILQKHGQRFSFTLWIPAGQPLRILIAESIQEDLGAVGITMKVRQVELNQILSAMVNRPQDWEAILIAEDISPYPTGEELFKTGGYLNNNGYSSPEMDKAIDASTDTPGMDGLFAYQDFASAQEPVIFLPNEQYSILVRNGLHGVEDFINPLGYWAPEKLTCDSPR